MTNLSQFLEEPQQPQPSQELPEVDPTALLKKLTDICLGLEISIRANDARLDMMELMVSQLAMKDPDMRPKLEAMLAAAQETKDESP